MDDNIKISDYGHNPYNIWAVLSYAIGVPAMCISIFTGYVLLYMQQDYSAGDMNFSFLLYIPLGVSIVLLTISAFLYLIYTKTDENHAFGGINLVVGVFFGLLGSFVLVGLLG